MSFLFSGSSTVLLSRLIRFLKLARYSPALATIGRVLAAERRALLACLIIISGVMMAAASAMHVVVEKLHPDRLGDRSKAMWWSAAMLAEIGDAAAISDLVGILMARTVPARTARGTAPTSVGGGARNPTAVDPRP